MRVKNENELVYLGTQTRVSQNGNSYDLLTIGDPIAFQNEQFFLTDEIKPLINNLNKGDKINAYFDYETQGRLRQMNLVHLEKVTK